MRLFVLGAGFSKAFNEAAPLMNGFLSNYLPLLDSSVTTEFEYAAKFIRDCGYDNPDDELRSPASANIETLMTLAGMTKPWLEQEEAAASAAASEQIKKLILRVIDESFPREPYGETHSDSHFTFATQHTDELNGFADYLIKGRGHSHVLTFNYDLLLENVLEFRQDLLCKGKSECFHTGEFYGFHALKVTPKGKITTYARNPLHSDIFVLKLHGSLNWRKRRGYQVVASPDSTLVLSAHDSFLENYPLALRSVTAEFESAPFIIPPILDKTALVDQPLLNVIWCRAERLIREADRIFFVGYSFPPTDFYAEFLFRRNIRHNCEVEVVNVEPKGKTKEEIQIKRRQFKNRFRDICCRAKRLEFNFSGAAHFCEQLGNA